MLMFDLRFFAHGEKPFFREIMLSLVLFLLSTISQPHTFQKCHYDVSFGMEETKSSS